MIKWEKVFKIILTNPFFLLALLTIVYILWNLSQTPADFIVNSFYNQPGINYQFLEGVK